MLTLDAETGRALWQFRAPGAGLCEHYLPGPEHVLLQSIAGELLALSAVDGRLMYRRRAHVPWPHPPLLIDANHAVYAEGPRLHAIDLDTATEQWSYAPAGPASLSGAATQFRRDGADLMLIVERNYGCELERVQLSDGKPNLRPQFLSRNRADLARAAVTPNLYAIPVGNEVIALDNGAGGRRWELKLPRVANEPWRVRATRSALLVHPDQALPHASRSADFAGLPTLDRVQAAASMHYYRWSQRTFPVMAVSVTDGKKLQELAVPCAGVRATVVLGERPAVIVGGRMNLLLR
jgi:outer membrane protein assembly factor BamB